MDNRKHAVDAVVGSYAAIVIVTTLDDNQKNMKEALGPRAEAMGLSVLIKKYSFVFLMLFLQKLLYLQKWLNSFA
jgi:hypothetical protein